MESPNLVPMVTSNFCQEPTPPPPPPPPPPRETRSSAGQKRKGLSPDSVKLHAEGV